MRRPVIALAFALLTSDLPAQVPTSALTFEVEYATTLIDIRSYQDLPVGATFVVICPSAGPIQPIWGTDTYTSDSSICLAAIHAGALMDDRAIVEVAPGLDAYVGTARNGLTSQSYPAWNSSFRFPRAGTSSVGFLHHAQGDWRSRPDQGTAPVGARVRFECAAGGVGGPIWGTGIYTEDSSICEAAVHAGIITRARGGTVIFELLGAQPSFRGSVQNGVASASYGEWPRSFRFIRTDG
jgi:hypothetical protein